MKVYEIIDEMTMQSGKYNFQNYFPQFDFSQIKYIGDADEYKVFESTINGHDYYILSDDSKKQAIVGEFKDTTFSGSQVSEFLKVQVYPGYEGKRLLEKLLWFLKSQHQKTILIGSHISKQMKDSLIRLNNTKRFNIMWKKDDGETASFDNNTIDKFTSLMKPTEWRILIERCDSGIEKFFNGIEIIIFE